MSAYAGYKSSVLERRQKVDIVTAVIEENYDHTYTFGAEQGLNIGVFLFDAFDPTTYRQIDPTYGRIRFSKFKWALGPDGFTLYPR